MSHAARSHIVRALPGLWCSIAVLPCFSASGRIPVTRCGLPLRGTYAAYSAFSFGFRLSALRNTHNPSELHGKRMAERLPLQCSGTLSGGTLCHLPTVVPHRFFRRGFRLYRLRIAQPFSMCRHTWSGDAGTASKNIRGVVYSRRFCSLLGPAYFHSKPDVTPASPFCQHLRPDVSVADFPPIAVVAAV